MRWFHALARTAAAGAPSDLWGYLSNSLPAGAVLNGGGLAALVFLFARDLILTRGQHERRMSDLAAKHAETLAELKTYHRETVAELVKHHAELVLVKDERYLEVEQQRNYYREARIEERDRAAKVTDQLAESLEVGRLAVDALVGLGQAQGGVAK